MIKLQIYKCTTITTIVYNEYCGNKHKKTKIISSKGSPSVDI